MKESIITNFRFFLLLALLLSGCVSENFIENDMGTGTEDSGSEPPVENKYADFDFKMVEEYQVNLRTLNLQDELQPGVYLELYTEYPLDAQGVLTEAMQAKRVYSGITDKTGTLSATINPPNTVDSLYILPFYIGLPPMYVVALQGNDIDLTLGGHPGDGQSGITTGEVRSLNIPPVTRAGNYYALGGWNWRGTVNYLEPNNDVITSSFLESVNNSLPERSRLPESHPDYLANEMDANLELIEDGEVYVTFVHEGAGYRNLLGYFTYPTENPPASVNDLTDMTIIFPDVSMGGNANLVPGNKVQLYYLDPTTGAYTDIFPEGISVGWFLIANGWHSHNNAKYYSIPSFNPEATVEKRKHNVLLYDRETERLILGFEDLDRCCGDDDFNDAVFFATVTPPSAIDISAYQPVDDNVDDDSDGVSDIFDDYPEDPTRAFDNPYPAEGEYASLVYEDLWPSRGDYDFNDMVIDYYYNPITNASNEVVAIEAKIKVKAIGASYHNAFGIQLDIPWDKVASVSGNQIKENYLSFNANGTESGQSDAVIIFFDNAYRLLTYPGMGIGINTEEGAPYVAPVEFTTTITFTEPVAISQIGPPPYNPFIIVNRDRSVEIHLPEEAPTDLANTNLFGTGDDDSNPGAHKYYMSDDNLPWGLNIPSDWEYPVEKRVITNTYLKFDDWAVSQGATFNDWYDDQVGYKNLSFVYRRQ